MKRKTNLAIVMMLVFALVVAACGNNSANNEGNSNQGSTDAASGNSGQQEQLDITAKYDPPVEVTAWRYTESTYKYENGDAIGDNIYTRAYKDDLGIDLKYKWTVPIEQFEQKMNVSIASGDLPDVMWLTNKQLTDLADND